MRKIDMTLHERITRYGEIERADWMPITSKQYVASARLAIAAIASRDYVAIKLSLKRLLHDTQAVQACPQRKSWLMKNVYFPIKKTVLARVLG